MVVKQLSSRDLHFIVWALRSNSDFHGYYSGGDAAFTLNEKTEKVVNKILNILGSKDHGQEDC